jgi:hypothetical protein
MIKDEHIEFVATMEDRMRYAKEHPETQAPSASDNAQP